MLIICIKILAERILLRIKMVKVSEKICLRHIYLKMPEIVPYPQCRISCNTRIQRCSRKKVLAPMFIAG